MEAQKSNTEQKPIVTYLRLVTPLHKGECAYIVGIKNHPHLGNRTEHDTILTSRVVAVLANGEFETLNTRYIPESPSS